MEKQPRRLPDALVVTAGLLCLLALGIAALLARGGEFSEGERRYLAERPGISSLTNWKTDQTTETFLKDHLPARQALVALDSSALILSGRNSQLGAWVVSGAIVEPPVSIHTAALESKLRRFQSLADTADVPWLLLTPPTHGWLLRDRMIPVMANAYEGEAEGYALLEACSQAVQLPEAFEANPDTMYYSTDHHWTLQGAYQAYLALAEPLGYEPLPLSAFRLSDYSGFRGTTLSRSGLPPLWGDTLTCAEPDSPVLLTAVDRAGEATWDHLIFPENATTWDGYAVYLNGNHGTLVIDRPGAPEGTLIVYKDSMANCLLPLLSRHYHRIVAVDARYDSGIFSDALAGIDDLRALLFVYSLDSLMNDTEITRKAK